MTTLPYTPSDANPRPYDPDTDLGTYQRLDYRGGAVGLAECDPDADDDRRNTLAGAGYDDWQDDRTIQRAEELHRAEMQAALDSLLAALPRGWGAAIEQSRMLQSLAMTGTVVWVSQYLATVYAPDLATMYTAIGASPDAAARAAIGKMRVRGTAA